MAVNVVPQLLPNRANLDDQAQDVGRIHRRGVVEQKVMGLSDER